MALGTLHIRDCVDGRSAQYCQSKLNSASILFGDFNLFNLFFISVSEITVAKGSD